jgi:hypothetical protein
MSGLKRSNSSSSIEESKNKEKDDRYTDFYIYIEKTSDIDIYIQEETIYSRYPIWLGIVEFLIFRINDGISNFDDNNRN